MIRSSSIVRTPFFVTREGLRLAGRKFVSREKEGNGIPVIISHGFTSRKEDVERYARQFAAWGFTAYTFDFAGGGPKSESAGLFSEMTALTEKADLLAVMDYVREKNPETAGKLILMGCSQGGFVSAMAASERAGQVDKLILFYPALCIPDDARRGRMMFYRFDPANVPETVAMAGPPVLPPIGRRYVTDVQPLNAFGAFEGYEGDVLFVHGTKDRVVPCVYSEIASAALAGRPGNGESHLVLVNGAGHSFKGRADDYAVQAVRQFLLGREEVLTVDVRLIKPFDTRTDGQETVTTLPFDGTVRGAYFEGIIQPGAKDVQKRVDGMPVDFCADYTVTGIDCTGTACTVHIVNRTSDGVHWKPEVSTDSEALSFFNESTWATVFESRKGGPIIHLYA